MIRAAIKFCGGCDPAFDRSAYWAALREAAQGRIEWVSLEAEEFEAVLVMDGCQAACMAGEHDSGALEIPESARVVRVKDDGSDPESVINKLLGVKND